MDSCTDYVLVILALIRLGAVHVPVNTAFRGEFLRRILDQTKPTCVVVDEAYGPQLVGRLSEEAKPLVVVRGDPDTIGGLSTVGLADLAEPERRAPTLNAHHDDVVTIAYTSGTTGRSKGAMLTHGVLVFESLCALADTMRLDVEHVGMHAAPLTHGSGHNALAFTMKGCTQVILSKSGFDVEMNIAVTYQLTQQAITFPAFGDTRYAGECA